MTLSQRPEPERTVRRVAVAAPEYWPRVRFLALALYAEEVLLTDSLQYSRQSYQNRTRLRTTDGWHWMTVPLRGGQHGRPIREVEIAEDADWRGAHRRSLQHHYGTAPFFAHFAPQIFALIDRPWERLGALTCATSEWTMRAAGLRASIVRTSSLTPPPTSIRDLSDRFVGAEGLTLEDSPWPPPEAFPRTRRVSFREAERHQNFAGFEPEMSALDLLFNHGPDARRIIARDTLLHRD